MNANGKRITSSNQIRIIDSDEEDFDDNDHHHYQNQYEDNDEDILAAIKLSELEYEKELKLLSQAIEESNRAIEVETQNKAYEETQYRDILEMSKREEISRRKKRRFDQNFSIDEKDEKFVCLRIMVGDLNRSLMEKWSVKTKLQLIFEWIACQYLLLTDKLITENDIELHMSGSLQSFFYRDTEKISKSLEEVGIRESTVFHCSIKQPSSSE